MERGAIRSWSCRERGDDRTRIMAVGLSKSTLTM